jgi:hypothetical protein
MRRRCNTAHEIEFALPHISGEYLNVDVPKTAFAVLGLFVVHEEVLHGGLIGVCGAIAHR